MRKLLNIAVLVSVATGALTVQWLNLPVEKARVVVVPLTVTQMESIRNAEKQNQQDLRDARAVRQIVHTVSCGGVTPADIVGYSRRARIAPRIVAGTIMAESSCQPSVVSSRGAIGLMQINERVWKTGRNLKDPRVNVEVGSRILGGYIHAYGVREGLHRYNGLGDSSDDYATRVLTFARVN